jgi:hypothetical protein
MKTLKIFKENALKTLEEIPLLEFIGGKSVNA